MSITDTLRDSYQFTAQDIENFWEISARYFLHEPISEEETGFMDLVDDADRLSRIVKRLPTMGEVRDYWRNENEKQKR